jgi:hypothetical protein
MPILCVCRRVNLHVVHCRQIGGQRRPRYASRSRMLVPVCCDLRHPSRALRGSRLACFAHSSGRPHLPSIVFLCQFARRHVRHVRAGHVRRARGLAVVRALPGGHLRVSTLLSASSYTAFVLCSAFARALALRSSVPAPPGWRVLAVPPSNRYIAISLLSSQALPRLLTLFALCLRSPGPIPRPRRARPAIPARSPPPRATTSAASAPRCVYCPSVSLHAMCFCCVPPCFAPLLLCCGLDV